MMVLITYDVNTETNAGRKRLRKIAKQCVNNGQRVQNSVFECLVDPSQFSVLRNKLEKIADPSVDSLRYYFLGAKWKNRIDHFGAKPTYDPEGILIT
ncbi:MAG: CRISPR-associated endonuclease Cas2 [Vulcanibacillus sp.]